MRIYGLTTRYFPNAEPLFNLGDGEFVDERCFKSYINVYYDDDAIVECVNVTTINDECDKFFVSNIGYK